jgi:hypothetical protein
MNSIYCSKEQLLLQITKGGREGGRGENGGKTCDVDFVE